MRVSRAWLFAVLIGVGGIGVRAVGQEDAGAELKKLRQRVEEGRQGVGRLEAQWFERDPGMKIISDRAKALRELSEKMTQGRYRVRNYIKLEQAFDPEIENKFERLKMKWKPKALADLVADPVTEEVAKFMMTWDANRMNADVEGLKQLKPELREKDLSTPEAFWSAARPVLIDLGEKAVKDFDAAAKESGLPDWAVVQAKRETEVNGGETLEVYVMAKTPKEVEKAREELKKLEGRLSRAEFENERRKGPRRPKQ
jgi:hypothetical protein